MPKIAVYVAGDENIFFPALVALWSIERHNPGIFERYMCFPESKISDEQKSILRKYGIHFIDGAALDQTYLTTHFKPMSEGHWPVEVFYNWIIHQYLLDRGHKYSIKCDYDILCIGTYDISRILPNDGQLLSGLCFALDLSRAGVSAKTLQCLTQKGNYLAGPDIYMNVGFVAFDNSLVIQENFIQRYADTYSTLYASNPDIEMIEQVALACLIRTMNERVKKLPMSYNHRVRWGTKIHDDQSFDIRNIHYITGNKPWRPINANKMDFYIQKGHSAIFHFREIWIQYASQIEECRDFIPAELLSERVRLADTLQLLDYYQRYIKKLEDQLEAERKSARDLKDPILSAFTES